MAWGKAQAPGSAEQPPARSDAAALPLALPAHAGRDSRPPSSSRGGRARDFSGVRQEHPRSRLPRGGQAVPGGWGGVRCGATGAVRAEPGALTGCCRRGAAGRARGAGPAPRQPTAAAGRRIRRRDVGKPRPQPRAVGAKVRRAGRPRPTPWAVAPPPRPFPAAGPIQARPRAREIARCSRRDEPGASRLLQPGAHGNHWSPRPGPLPLEAAHDCAARHTRAYLVSFRAAAAELPGSPRFNPGGWCCRRSRCQTPAGTSLPPDSRARPPRAAAAGGVTLLPPEPGPPAAASVTARPGRLPDPDLKGSRPGESCGSSGRGLSGEQRAGEAEGTASAAPHARRSSALSQQESLAPLPDGARGGRGGAARCTPGAVVRQGEGRRGGHASRDGGRAEVGVAASAARRTCCAPRVPPGAVPCPSRRGTPGSGMAAELRLRLAEALQLVARRNEKSGVELSRFVAKQVRSGRCGARWQPPDVCIPSVRDGLCQGRSLRTVERREGSPVSPPCRHPLPAALRVPDLPGRPRPSGSRRELNPLSLSLPPSLPPWCWFLPSSPLSGGARKEPMRKVLFCILVPFLLRFASQYKSSIHSMPPEMTPEA